MGVDYTLLLLLLILGLGLIVPELFKKLRLPYVTSLILIGAFLGPYGLDYIQSNEVIDFFGFLGFTFLMFMAGLETNIKYIKKSTGKVFLLALINGGIPFIVGFGLAKYFNYSLIDSALLGTIFLASSMAIILPSIKEARLFKKDVGQLMISAIMVQDIASLFLLALIFQGVNPSIGFSLPVYFVILVVSILLMALIIPRLAEYFIKKHIISKDKEHENQLRFVMLILIAVLIYFEVLGVHPILAAFLTGMMLNHFVTSHHIYKKLHTLGYGLFVPVFFFIIGMQLDFSVIFNFDFGNVQLILVILGAMLSKYISGYIAGRLVKFKPKYSNIFGVVSMTHLTTTLAATYTASAAGLLNSTLITSIVLLTVITTIFVPIILKLYVNKIT